MAITSNTLIDLLQKLYKDYQSGKTKGLGELEGAKNLYGPEYLKGAETEALAGIEQSMTGRGLSNTTLPVSASIGMKRKFQDERLRGKAGAMTNIADFIAKFMPNPATLSHLATGGFSGTLAAQNQAFQNQPASRTYGASSFPSFGAYGTLGGGSGGAGGGGGSAGGGSYSAPSMPSYGSSYNTGATGGGSGYNAPREYDPSMVGQSMWQQQGSQVGGGGTLTPASNSAISSGSATMGTSNQPAYIEGHNYAYVHHRRTGEKLSQQAAYAALGAGYNPRA